MGVKISGHRATPPEDIISSYTAILAGTEVGMGSFIHGFHLPLGGHLLSLNQGIILTLAAKRAGNARLASKCVNSISSLSACLKALAPAGKKLTPMLALSVQGVFYSFGFILGWNIWGVSASMALMSIWAFAQPLLIYYLFFGHSLFDGIFKLWEDVSKAVGIPLESGLWFLAALVLLKAFVAVGAGIYAWRATEDWERRYVESNIQSKAFTSKAQSHSRPHLAALGDLLSPVFLVSLGVSLFALYFHQSESMSQNFWIYLLRPIGVGYAFFLLVRLIPESRVRQYLKNYPRLESAVDNLSRRSRT